MRRIKLFWILIAIVVLIGAALIARAALAPASPLTTSAGTGVVTGTLDTGSLKNLPYNTQDLYLATLIYSNQPDKPPVISFTYGTDPQATVHAADGRFAFTNVPPGTYALIVWTPAGGFPIEAPDGGFIKVVVEDGKTTNLGTVVSHKSRPYP